MTLFARVHVPVISRLSAECDIVNAQNHLDGLCGQLDGTCRDQQGLQNVLLGNVVVDTTALDTDTGRLLAHLVAMSKFRDDLDLISIYT